MKSNNYFRSKSNGSIILGIVILFFVSNSLRSQSLTVQTPNGGEFWTYGGSEIISWTGNNLSSVISIEFSYDGGTNWWYFGQVPSGPNGGSATLGVPNVQTTNAILKLTDDINPTATDMSDGPFTVYVPPIVIFEPTSSSAVFAGGEAYVYWNMTVFDFTYMNAELSIDNGMTYAPIAQNINAWNYYTYIEMPDTTSDSCILKLYNVDDPTEFGLSAVFTISPPPVYNLITPATGELVNTNSYYTITWTVADPYSEYCFLEYSTNNGQTWEVINNATNQGNSGSYEWFTPNVNSEECLIRISDSYALNSIDTSGMFTIFPFPEAPVCMVSVDSLTNNNTIVWERPVTDIIDVFLVYKETDEANVYEVIDTVDYDSLLVSVDEESDPSMRPYRYKLGFIDTEGRVFPTSDFHQTVHLTINQGANNAWNLIWTPYIGFDYASCKIMRKTDSGDYEQIATVSSSFSSFTDFNAPPGEVFYMIEIEHPDGCDPAAARDGEYASVYSNVATNNLVAVSESKELNFSIYPNPADKLLNVSFGENITGEVRLIIGDLTGRVVYSEDINDVRPGQVKSISSLGLKEGMYLLRISSGENNSIKKIVIKH